MDHRESIFGECVDERNQFDLGCFAERLVLFERVVLRSTMLTEIPTLVRAFGAKGLRRLLDTGALSIDVNAYGIGNRAAPGSRPLSYRIGSIRATDDPKREERWILLALDAVPDLGRVERERLANAVHRRLARLPVGFGRATLAHLRRDVESNLPTLHLGALMATSNIVGVKIRPADLTLRFHVEDDDGGYRAETNLLQIGLDENQAHKVLESALLAVAGTEKKLEQMRVHNSICTFRETEVAMLEEKIQLTSEQYRADPQSRRLARVLRLKEFPSFSQATATNTLDFSRLLEVREMNECREFRRWLREIDDLTDGQLEERMRSMRSTLAALAQGMVGKAVRFGINLVPLAPAVAAAASAADSFVLDRVLGKPGPLAFLDDAVGSIFKGDA